MYESKIDLIQQRALLSKEKNPTKKRVNFTPSRNILEPAPISKIEIDKMTSLRQMRRNQLLEVERESAGPVVSLCFSFKNLKLSPLVEIWSIKSNKRLLQIVVRLKKTASKVGYLVMK